MVAERKPYVSESMLRDRFAATKDAARRHRWEYPTGKSTYPLSDIVCRVCGQSWEDVLPFGELPADLEQLEHGCPGPPG